MGKILLTYLVCLLSIGGSAQTVLITGVVTDENNKPVQLATISVVGKSYSAVTVDDGRFSLTLKGYAKGDNINLRIGKPGFIPSTKLETVSDLPLLIQIKRKNALAKGDKIGNGLARPSDVQAKKDTTIIDQSVKSYGQTGGITAYNVLVPEEQAAAGLNDNFIATKRMFGNRYSVGFRPKVGEWDTTFIAVRWSEKEKYQISFIPDIGTGGILLPPERQIRADIGIGPELLCIFIECEPASTKTFGYGIICDSLPSVVIFGEYRKKEYRWLRDANQH